MLHHLLHNAHINTNATLVITKCISYYNALLLQNAAEHAVFFVLSGKLDVGVLFVNIIVKSTNFIFVYVRKCVVDVA